MAPAKGFIVGGPVSAYSALFYRLSARLHRGGGAEEPTVPVWFKPNPKNPYAIFDAWRNLSTTEAVVCWRSNPSVYAGCLRDETGRPIASCPLWVFDGGFHFGSEAGFGGPNQLKTDKDGYFIVYSPRRELAFSAAPGCPFSAIGLQFAEANERRVTCEARVIQVSDERRFYALTCPRKSTYDEEGFRKFVDSEWTRWKKKPRNQYVAPVKAWAEQRSGSSLDKYDARSKYLVRVVSPKGAAIPGATVQFTAWDCWWNDNAQTVLTDAKGECTLFEQFLSGQQKKYYDGVRRWLTLDIPGYAVGPVPFRLKKNVVNVITAKEAACARGRIVDGNGNGLRGCLESVTPTITISLLSSLSWRRPPTALLRLSGSCRVSPSGSMAGGSLERNLHADARGGTEGGRSEVAPTGRCARRRRR